MEKYNAKIRILDYIQEVEPEFATKNIYQEIDHEYFNLDSEFADTILQYAQEPVIIFEDYVKNKKIEKFNKILIQQSD